MNMDNAKIPTTDVSKIEICHIQIKDLQVEIVRKDIKHLHLGVYPPDGKIRVAAPLRVNNETVRLAVISKLAWIKQQQAKFQNQPRQSEREMVTNESHDFLGKRYRLRIVPTDGKPQVMRQWLFLVLYVKPNTTQKQRQKILQTWHRQELKRLIGELLKTWQPRLNLYVAQWGVRRMKTRWGSCYPTAQRIWLNLELVKKPVHCIEYVLVHELVHLRYRKHDHHFYDLLTQVMPQWQRYRDELKLFPLAHEKWKG